MEKPDKLTRQEFEEFYFKVLDDANHKVSQPLDPLDYIIIAFVIVMIILTWEALSSLVLALIA